MNTKTLNEVFDNMNKTYIYADKFFFNSSTVGPGYLEIINGRFGDFYRDKPTWNHDIIDYRGYSIAPGLVDTHIHGFKNHDVMDNDANGLKVMSEALLSTGVTSFLPTTLTADHELLNEVAKTISQTKDEVTGAKIQGIFFEGPFFTEKYKGAQNPSYFTDPDLNTFYEWQVSAKGLINKIAIAPERNGAEDFTHELTKHGVIVSLGHSDATFQEAREVVNAGASIFVHAFNGMRGLSHREPGMVGAAMSLKNTYSEIICDGHHVHPSVIKLFVDTIGKENVILITDSMMAGGMPDGNYMLGEFPVTLKDGTARLNEGSLAGSVLKLNDAVKNMVDWGIATPEEAIMMATYTPAKSIDIDHVCGQIKKGRSADFTVFDQQMNLKATYLDGICRFKQD